MIPSFQRSGVSCAFVCFLSLAAGTTALRAGSATWAAQPKDNLWDKSANWNPKTIPDESGDVATFGQSSITAISASVGPDGAEIVFQPGSSAYTITGDFGDIGRVVNNSGVVQSFVITGSADFEGKAGAGVAVSYQTLGDGLIDFASGGSAEASNILVSGGGSEVIFDGGSTAAQSTITCDGGYLRLEDNSTAGEATLVARNGEIIFFPLADGRGARVILGKSGGLVLEEEQGRAGPVTIGSIEGQGSVTLGNPLIVGSNGRSTTYSGSILSQNSLATLTKVGRGTLYLEQQPAEPRRGGGGRGRVGGE